jgi:hypothetical protein
MGLEAFAVLTKRQEDLLRKSYCYTTPALVTLSAVSGGVLFKARASQRVEGTTVAKASLQYKKDKVTFTPKRKSDGTSAYVLEYAHNSDIKLKSECKVTRNLVEKAYETTLSAEYSQPQYRAKVALVEPELAVKGSATLGNERLGVAVDWKFDVAAQRLVGYGFAHYWLDKQCRVVLKHVGTDKTKFALGDFSLSYFQETSAKSSVAAIVKYNHPKSETFIEFGGAHMLTSDTELRGKVDSNGMLAGSFTRLFNDNLKLTLASQVDVKKIVQTSTSDFKFGVRLDLNA